LFCEAVFKVANKTNAHPLALIQRKRSFAESRVARWFLFKPKIPIGVNFGGALDWKMLVYLMAIWSILQTYAILMTILYILCSFDTFFRFWFWQPWLRVEDEEGEFWQQFWNTGMDRGKIKAKKMIRRGNCCVKYGW
jgi:hypothetical protein